MQRRSEDEMEAQGLCHQGNPERKPYRAPTLRLIPMAGNTLTKLSSLSESSSSFSAPTTPTS